MQLIAAINRLRNIYMYLLYIVFLRRRSEYVVYSIKGCHSYFVAIVVTKQSSSTLLTYNMGTSTICLCICKVLGV